MGYYRCYFVCVYGAWIVFLGEPAPWGFPAEFLLLNWGIDLDMANCMFMGVGLQWVILGKAQSQYIQNHYTSHMLVNGIN